MKSVTVLCTSVGGASFPSVFAALKRQSREYQFRIIGTDIRESAAGLYVADEGILVKPRKAKTHLRQIKQIIAEYQVDLFLPLSTEDQTYYAKRRSKIDVPIVTSDYRYLRIANNKYRLLSLLEQRGLRDCIPAYAKVTTAVGLERLVKQLGYPSRKVVIRLDQATGAEGLKIIDPARTGRDRLLDRDNREVGLREVLNWLSDGAVLSTSHIVEYLPGDEYSVDILCRQGNALATVVRRRNSSLWGLAMDAIVVDEPDVRHTAEAVVRELKLDYVANVQIRRDGEGHPKIMEVNPRIPGTIQLTIAAGVNMPYLAIKLALGEKVVVRKPIIGTRILRTFEGVIIDDQRCLRHL